MPRYTATVTVSAEQWGREAEAVDNTAISIGLKTLEPGVFELSFDGQLDAPEEATHVCVTLDNGLTYYGPITGGKADPQGGWLSFECDMIEPELLG